MKRKDIKIGETYLAEDKMGKYEVTPLVVDPDEARRLAFEADLRFTQRNKLSNGSHILVGRRHLRVDEGEVTLGHRAWSGRDPEEWEVYSFSLAQFKESFEMEEYRERVAREYEVSQILLRERKEGAEERRVVLQKRVDEANAKLGFEVFTVENWSRDFRVPSWQVKYAHSEASLLIREVLGEE